ncbi:hypothetical protein INS49_000674 [Diaporthe citri]|uniref:uncharacterized protein n=1 Tax=Diaporthe citri TaxID=83186 RepID=UPI001C7F8EDE|nr:uncharacterized protein INS49_000674 [Diaporthe citri]KAG6366497.1 hypothetical protein INS49_000674 [Diaporthe citri]
MSEVPVSFAIHAEPSSVLAVVRREPRPQVVHLEKVRYFVRYSTSWVLLTSAGQRDCRIASRAVRSSWRDVPGLLLSIMKITGYQCDFTGARRNSTVDSRSEESLMWYDDDDLMGVVSAPGLPDRKCAGAVKMRLRARPWW